MRLSQLSAARRYYYRGGRARRPGTPTARDDSLRKNGFLLSPLFFFFSFSIFLSFPIISDPPKEKTSPQLRGTTRAIVFRALLRRRSGRPTICTNNVANSRSGMGEGRRIARGAEATEEKICSELWSSRAEKRVAFAESAACATPRPAVAASCKSPATAASASATHMARKYCSTSPTRIAQRVRDSIDYRCISRQLRDCETVFRVTVLNAG